MPYKHLPAAVAAVDLGSNSFHLVVARQVQGQLAVVDRLREPVRLAAGLDANGELGREARARAVSCLERFGQRLQGMPPDTVRAVGTNALRRARNARGFLRRASEALAHPIEVISGAEEARLIYQGVANDRYQDSGRRLVIDIGGGSTEIIVGEGFDPLEASSLYMGCVSYSERFFPEGRVTNGGMKRAILAARLELEPLERRYRALGWTMAVGSSGTILAIEMILRAAGWSDSGITAKGLSQLRRELVSAGGVRQPDLPGLQPSRAAVLPGGLAILVAAFEALGLDRLVTSSGALREGLMHDLLGRIGQEDVRDRTTQAFAQRYHVDLEQASRVERTAELLLGQVAESWNLTGDLPQKLLGWAARLHEIGLTVAHGGYHKHGAYLVAHSDMPGFSRENQELLALLIRYHRRKLRIADLSPAPPPLRSKAIVRLCVLLRLAVRLNRSRSQEPLPDLLFTARKSQLELSFPEGWLDAHPLSRGDLEDEAQTLKAIGLQLELR